MGQLGEQGWGTAVSGRRAQEAATWPYTLQVRRELQSPAGCVGGGGGSRAEAGREGQVPEGQVDGGPGDKRSLGAKPQAFSGPAG